MNFRTDLALEAAESLPDSNLPEGVQVTTRHCDSLTLSIVEISTPNAAKALGKPEGLYITAELPPFYASNQFSQREITVLAGEIRALLPKHGDVLVVGLGNRAITPDNLGPAVSTRLLATRHLSGELARSCGLGSLRAVSVLAPGVMGQTGIESGEIIRALTSATAPAAVIAVDALAAQSLSRLGRTIQLSNAGISPGSGVMNSRFELSESTLGVPVISLGVPTVVDAATLTEELSGAPVQLCHRDTAAGMMVTPREVDLLIERAAKVIALAINHALQPHLSLPDIEYLVS